MKSRFISFLRHAIRFVLLFCLSASLLACSPALGYRPERSAQIIDNGTYVFHVCRRHPVVAPNFSYWYEDGWGILQTTPMPLLELLESHLANAVFLYDPYAPPESIKFLGVEYDKLPCDKPPPPPPPPPKPPPPKPPPPKKMVAKAETPRKTSQTTGNTGPRPPSTQSREPRKNQRPDPHFVGQSYPTPAPASVVQIPGPPPPVGKTHAEQTANLEQREAEARARRVGERIGAAWGDTLGGAEEARKTLNGLLGGGLNELLQRNRKFAEDLQKGLALKLDAIPLLPDYSDPKLNEIAYQAFLKGYDRGLADATLKFGIMNGMATVLLAVGPEAAMALETAGAKALKAAWQRLNDMPVFLPTGVGGPGGFVRRVKAPAAQPTTTQVVTTQVTAVEAEATTTVTTKTVPVKTAPVEAAPGAKVKPVPNKGAGATRPPNAAEPKPRGGNTPEAKKGMEVHEAFKKKVKEKQDAGTGWEPNPQKLIDPATGRKVVPDALTPKGNPIELKPNTPSGKAAGKKQMEKYERATKKKGRVIYYEP